MFEAGGEFGEEPGQGGAVALGEPAEEVGFGGEQVGVGVVEERAAGRGELDGHGAAVAARGRPAVAPATMLRPTGMPPR
jgi:hypothetical protein